MARFQCRHCGIIADTEKTSADEWDDIAAAHLRGAYAWDKLQEKK